MPRFAWTLVLVTLIAPIALGQWSDLKLRFVYDAVPPKPIRLADSLGEAFCGDLSLVDQRLVVNQANRGIANVVVYAYQGPGGKQIPRFHASALGGPKTHELANVNCNYVPRVLVMKAGDELSIVNTDVIGYNAMLGFIAGDAKNFSLPPKSKARLKLDVAEPAPIPVECTIYPWMKARMLILNHRYSAVSNGNGVLEIKNLPAGMPITLRIYHESADLRGLKIGKATVNRRGVFEVTLEDQTDQTDVMIGPGRFRELASVTSAP